VAWEESMAMDPPDGFVPIDRRRYGDSWITLLRYEPAAG